MVSPCARRTHRLAAASLAIALIAGAAPVILGGSSALPVGALARAGAATSPSASGPPAALATLRVSAPSTSQVLAVSWSYAPSSPRPTKLHLELFSVVDGTRYPVAATIVGQTVEPDSYTIPAPVGSWVVRATPENAAGFGPGSTSPVVTVKNPCPTATLCASVTPAYTPTTVHLAAQGFLLGVADDTAGTLASHAIAPLSPRQWRFSGSADNTAARHISGNVSRIQILSDLWDSATAPANAGYARTPWSDWTAWQNFVTATVTQAERGGWAPDYWDVWNEPNGTCCPKFSTADQATITVARWLQTYAVAYRAIKAVDPKAKVIGPSLSALQWAPGSPSEFDLDTFLTYAQAHGIRWDAVSWHENDSAPSPGDMFPTIDNLSRHIAMAKAVMARHPGTVAGNAIMINEYGPSDTHMLAGWAVGEFRAFEDGGVGQANTACWTAGECTNQLDGLLTADGHTTAVWWAHELYARLSGQPRLHVTSSADWQLDGLATRYDKSRSVSVLLGRHWSCNAQANVWCTNSTPIPAASVSLDIAWPYGPAPVAVTVARVPAGTGALSSLPLVHATIRRTSSTHVQLTIPSVQDGDALWVLVRPAS